VFVATKRSMNEAVALRGELSAFAHLVEQNAELRATLLHPRLRPNERLRVVTALAERTGASEVLRRLLGLLADRGRLTVLPALAEAYAEQLNTARGVASAEVVSAFPLAEAQRRALVQALGKDAELRSEVNPAVLGGLLLRVGGKTYDGTVRTRLASLRRRLSGSG